MLIYLLKLLFMLAACVNIIPQLTSIYEWKGKIEEENESMLIIKTVKDRLIELEDIVNKLHPYDIQNLLFYRLKKGSEAYLKWIHEQTNKEENYN
ncbi:hypothetical protein Mgra_00009197 [Meloidogyne graminicola]|uniref:Divalent-cation tolerance protein CutA n=1 Tax=Meloidogyne graminicola TaxID=189291 RepID=A0A8S9ZDR2_9BILA|nr:hypothetical protein Mgra_00009197 [Meloidogyne graminicola]